MDLHIFHNIISNKIDLSDSLIIKFLQNCCDGKINEIENLIHKIDINSCDYDKRTGLHLAASEGHVDTVKLLIEKGAEVLKDRWGNTAIDEIKDKTGENYDSIRKLLS